MSNAGSVQRSMELPHTFLQLEHNHLYRSSHVNFSNACQGKVAHFGEGHDAALCSPLAILSRHDWLLGPTLRLDAVARDSTNNNTVSVKSSSI